MYLTNISTKWVIQVKSTKQPNPPNKGNAKYSKNLPSSTTTISHVWIGCGRKLICILVLLILLIFLFFLNKYQTVLNIFLTYDLQQKADKSNYQIIKQTIVLIFFSKSNGDKKKLKLFSFMFSFHNKIYNWNIANVYPCSILSYKIMLLRSCKNVLFCYILCLITTISK